LLTWGIVVRLLFVEHKSTMPREESSFSLLPSRSFFKIRQTVFMIIGPTPPAADTDENRPPHTGIRALAAHQPAKIFFWIAAAGVAVLLLGLRLERLFGNTPYGSQSSLERTIRLLAGMFVTMAPYFLFYALIYWALHRFNRPTSPRLNVLHVGLTVLGYGSMLLHLGWMQLSGKKQTAYLLEDSPSDILFAILFLLAAVVFIVNVAAALLKKRIDW